MTSYALIMAGGVGSRFWPKSRIEKPKQFLVFFDDKSLLQTTVDRIRPIIPVERIIVSTNTDYVELVKEQIPDLPEENIIGEPVGKNTAPCIAFAASLLQHREPGSTMVVLPSDHYIHDNDAFIKDLNTCIQLAEDEDELVTIGIPPTRPDTGYGYIQYNEAQTVSIDNASAYRVKTFAEKPDLQTALKFLQSGDFLWNSGMFIWRCEHILNEIKEHLPVLDHQIGIFRDSLKKNNGTVSGEILESVYTSCFSVSIDYGIMEKSDKVIVLPSNFGWSDLGSWQSVYELQQDGSDDNGNILEKNTAIAINSENCFMNTKGNKLIALVGLQGIGVIETDDAMLICNLENSQMVKDLYDKFTSKKLSKYR